MKTLYGSVSILLMLCINISIQVNSLKNEYICDCLYNSTPSYSSDTITFICFDHWRLVDFFTPVYPPYFKCPSDTGWWNAGLMDFRDCQMTKINYNIFGAFERLYSLNVSSIGLKELPKELFMGANYLKRLIASNNRLTEISESQFAHTPNLTEVDFSYNRIDRIHERAFMDTDQLRVVNISYNHIVTIHPNTFAYCGSLEILDLSFNDILKIESGTFIKLAALEFLSLKKNSLTNIEAGALVSQKHIETIHLNDNRLKDLDGFTHLHFPNVKLIEISRNDFNCSYLRAFLEVFNYRSALKDFDNVGIQIQNENNNNVNALKCIDDQAHNVTQTYEMVGTSSRRSCALLFCSRENSNYVIIDDYHSIQILLMISCGLTILCIITLIVVVLWTRKVLRYAKLNCACSHGIGTANTIDKIDNRFDGSTKVECMKN